VTFIVANIHRREYHPAVRPLQGNQAMAPITLREGNRLSTVARSSALRLECRR
jgi:hypothetical protein